MLAPDVQLLPGTMLAGRTVVGAGSVIGPDTQLVDTIVGEGAVVRQTVARESEIGDGATVGPYVSLPTGHAPRRRRPRRHLRRDQELRDR